jgi:hypothetical protein
MRNFWSVGTSGHATIFAAQRRACTAMVPALRRAHTFVGRSGDPVSPCIPRHPSWVKDAKAHNRHMTTQHGKTLNAHAPHTAADAAVDQHPFERLTPDVVLDALASVDLWGDGRLTTLNSYENRVYLAHLDEPCQGHHAVVLKFYRPERWTRAQIEEEHAFADELVQAEVPVVAPLALGPSTSDVNAPPGVHQTLHQHAGFGFSVSPYKGGRRPELDNFEVLEWVGRFIARIHTVGAAQPFAHRPALNATTFALESRNWLLGHQCVPLDMQSRWETALQTALDVLVQVAPELCVGLPDTPVGDTNNIANKSNA